jgi:hypothetical protein
VFQELGDLMRMLNLSVLAFSSLFAVEAALANDKLSTTTMPSFANCRSEARLKADEYVADYMVPATDEDSAPPHTYVAIIYGHKFIAPLHPPANGDLQIHGLGEVMAKRGQVYRDELRRCLGYVQFDLALKQRIIILE